MEKLFIFNSKEAFAGAQGADFNSKTKNTISEFNSYTESFKNEELAGLLDQIEQTKQAYLDAVAELKQVHEDHARQRSEVDALRERFAHDAQTINDMTLSYLGNGSRVFLKGHGI